MALGRDLSGNQPAPNFEMRWLGAIEFLERTDMPVQAGRALVSPSSVHPVLFGLFPYSSADRLRLRRFHPRARAATAIHCLSFLHSKSGARSRTTLIDLCHSSRVASANNYNALLGRKSAHIVHAAKVEQDCEMGQGALAHKKRAHRMIASAEQGHSP